MLRHHSNSLALARFLQRHPAVDSVVHPLTLPEGHPSRVLAETQNGGKHSGMFTFYVKGGEKAAFKFLESLKVMHELRRYYIVSI